MEKKTNIIELKDLREKIALLSQESPTYQKLAYYFDKNYKNVIFMTASEVASQASVSQGSVSRFCISLGYRGYNDFLQNLQQFVRKEITAPQRLQYTSRSQENIKNILNVERENMNELEALIIQPEYKKLVQQIVSAKHLVIISARMSATLLPYMHYVLNKIRSNVTEVLPGHPLWETLELLDPVDVHIVAIVFPRYPNVLLNKLKALHQKGFNISAITDSIVSPVVSLANPVVSVPITTSSIFDIYSMPVLFLNLLLRDVAKKTEGLDIRMSELEELDRKNQIYYQNNIEE